MDNPLVSVIITNYNYSSYLSKAIDSVLEQTYSNFEIIVVDDGSTDNSREVISHYSSKVITIFQENGGMSASRNTGFEKSSGEIICFLDADDYYHHDKLSKVVKAFEANPSWIFISHCWKTVDKEGKVIGKSTSDRLSKGDVTPWLIKWGKYASGITSALAFKRDVLQMIMPVRGNCGIDSFLNSKLPFYGDVGSLNEPLMFYRIHGKNIRAHSKNLSRLIQQRELIASFINEAAQQKGFTDSFDLSRDVDYLSYKAIEKGGGNLNEIFRIAYLSIRESIDIGRSPRDSFIRFMSRTISALPGQGTLILEYGLRGYIRSKIFSVK